MARKSKEHARLLKLYRATGDEEYRRAAECLNIPLMEWLEQAKPRRPGNCGPTVGKTVRPRLYRMARMIGDGANKYAAACREVTEHGYPPHASKEAAIKYLYGQYRDNREEIEAEFDELDRMLAGSRWFQAEAEAGARQVQAFERETTKLARMTRQLAPPAGVHTPHHHALPRWIRDLSALTRGIGLQMIGWKNTRPKSVEKRSNDRDAAV